MRAIDLAREMGTAVHALLHDRAALQRAVEEHGVPLALMIAPELVGLARIRPLAGGLYEPDEDGRLAYLTPCLVGAGGGPEPADAAIAVRYGRLVDIAAWVPDATGCATRRGAASWLGAVDWEDPFPTKVHRSPQGWLQAECSGLVLLTDDPAEARAIVGEHDVEAEDLDHAAELRRLLVEPIAPPPRITTTGRRRSNAAA